MSRGYNATPLWGLSRKTFVMVTEVSFPLSPSVNAVSFLIKLTWAPVSNRTFARFWMPSWPWIFAVIIGRSVLLVSVVAAIVILMALLLWRRMWWNWLHCAPFSSIVHCCLRLQFATLWSRPALFKQLKHTWFSLALFNRSSILRAANLGHWSGQWVEFLHSQHLWIGLLRVFATLSLKMVDFARAVWTWS